MMTKAWIEDEDGGGAFVERQKAKGTPPMTDALLRCPFCNDGDCDVVFNASADHANPKPSVVCVEGCGAIGPVSDTAEFAIAAWNRRSDPSLSLLREARALLIVIDDPDCELSDGDARNLIERIDTRLSSSPVYDEAVLELVRAAREAENSLTMQSTLANDGHEPERLKRIRKALAPFQEVK